MRVIVEGETRFSKVTTIVPAQGKQQQQPMACSSADAKALDLQQLFVAMTKELRIAVVKLADRLHNMRTLGSLAPDKQAKIALETLQVGSHGLQKHRHSCPLHLGICGCSAAGLASHMSRDLEDVD